MMELQEGVNKQDVSSRAERSTFHSCSISKSLMYGKAPKEYLSLWSVIALGIGSMVGAGIFALMGQATLMAGKNVYWSFILGGVAALLSGYTYAKLGSRYPGSGGIMDYFNEAFSHKTLSGALTLIYLGTLVITGEDLHIGKLSLDGGELHVDGRIDSVSYEDGGQERGGLFHRLFG